MSEPAVKLAARMYDARDAARLLCGSHYTEIMEKFGAAIKARMDAESRDLLDVTMSLAEEGPPELIIYWTAAAVEIAEPSTTQEQGLSHNEDC